MIEVLVASTFGLCIWAALHAYRPVDVVIEGRLEELVGRSKPRSAARGSGPLRRLLAGLGRRFPGSSAAPEEDLLGPDSSGASLNALRGAEIALTCCGFVSGLVTGVGAVVVSPVLALVGYRLPRMILGVRLRRRREVISVAVPDAVDLLAVCAQAGLSIPMSLQRVSERVPGFLGAELRRTLEEVELGVPRNAALAGLARRSRVADLESLVGVLAHAERFGIGVSKALQTFSEEVRIRRRQAAEEQARRAPVKMLFPLVFLILPAFILLTVVPMLLSAFASLSL